MRSLSAALQAAHGAAVQKPAWLIEVSFPTALRISSFGDLTAMSQSWTGYDVDVSRVLVDALSVRGELVIGNADDLIGALLLLNGVADRRIRIWGYDAGATADADFELLADCVGGAASLDHQRARITLRDSTAYVSSPRTFVTAAAGFTHLLPAGSTIKVGGAVVTLERD